MLVLPVKLDANGNLILYLKDQNKLLTSKTADIILDQSFGIDLNKNNNQTTPINYNPKSLPIPKILRKYQYFLDYLNDHNPIKESIKEDPGLQIEDLTNKLNKNYFTVQRDGRSGIDFIRIEKGTVIYKGMDETNLTVNNINNPHSGSHGWFTTNKEVANKYTSNHEKNGWKTYEFEVIRDLKLLLLNKNNVEIMLNKMRKDMGSHPNREIINNINILKALTGYGVNYKEQLEILKRLDKRAKMKIDGKKKWAHTFNDKRIKVGTNYYSHLREDLNRISITNALDRKLIKIICELYNVDGYYNWIVPSLWEIGEYVDTLLMNEEVGLCVQRGAIRSV
jgi:hypothetical protein